MLFAVLYCILLTVLFPWTGIVLHWLHWHVDLFTCDWGVFFFPLFYIFYSTLLLCDITDGLADALVTDGWIWGL